jgi:mRNA interferase RelE/StbE
MTFELAFLPTARKEWDKLDSTIQNQFKKKLSERLEFPRVIASQLSGMADCYKIKLRSSGYRLVYRVDDGELLVIVIAVGKRERSEIYEKARTRI